ncbi:MAG: hypothetical protein ACM3UZ_16420 [Acidobacteriota bacterium]
MAKAKTADSKPLVTMEAVADYLRCTGGFAPAAKEVGNRLITVTAAKTKGIKVSDEELQKASDAWRLFNGLFTAKETKNWLKNSGLTIDKYEDFLETNLLISKFKQTLAAEAKIRKIYKDLHCQEMATDLLYTDWLAQTLK